MAAYRAGVIYQWKIVDSALLILEFWLFSLAVLFQLVTLPVEYNASGRAVRILAETGMMQGEEIVAAKKVLNAVALNLRGKCGIGNTAVCETSGSDGRNNED